MFEVPKQDKQRNTQKRTYESKLKTIKKKIVAIKTQWRS